MQEKHEFALYYPSLSNLSKNSTPGHTVTLHDAALVARIMNILRLRVGELILLFDEHMWARCSINAASKKEIQCTLITKQNHQTLKPAITFVLPLLKKDDFETALYSLVELGATTIQLVTTEKTQRAWGGEKELERCHRVMIAAAEQSKNFAVPRLHPPCTVQSYLATIKSDDSVSKLYFDYEGMSARKVINTVINEQPESYLLMVGPEGDLTPAEKELLVAHSFQFCALTPTVLRSVQAVALSMGLVRSFVR